MSGRGPFGARDDRDVGKYMLLVAGAFVASLLVNTVESVVTRYALAAAFNNQTAAVAEADGVRRQVESLLAGTNDLAQSGNATAKAAMDLLARQGINFTRQPTVPAAGS